MGQVPNSIVATSTVDRAQAFTTGDTDSKLSSVEIVSADLDDDDMAVSVCTVDDAGYPASTSTCTALTPPRSFAAGILVYTASTPVPLDANTTYTLLITSPGGDNLQFGSTPYDHEDTGGAAGWSIANESHRKSSSTNDWGGTITRLAFRITIRGTTIETVRDPKVETEIPDQTATAGRAFRYAFPDNTFTDLDGDTLSYMATKADNAGLPTWLTFTPTTRTFSGMPQVADMGTVSVKVTASDGNGGSVSDTFDIVASANNLPTASNGEVTASEDTDYIFTAANFNFSDTDLSDALFSVKITSLPAAGTGTLKLDGTDITSANLPKEVTKVDIDAGKLTYSPPADANGYDYATFQFKVNDGLDDSATASTMTIDVTAVNDAPVAATVIPDQAATAGTAFNYAFLANTFSDADGDTLTYRATKADDAALPSWLTFTASTRTFWGTPQAADVETVSVKVTASDDKGGSVSDTFEIEVSASVPGAPTDLSATASGTTRINLTWTAPASSGAAAISGYKIEVSSDGGSNWTDRVADTRETTTTYAHNGLAAGATRHYRVSAINTNGAGGSSNIANATTGTTGATVPGAPTGLSATASGTTRINLTWTAPASNGGSAISGYKIESSSDGGSNWTDRVANTSSATTTYEHSGLAAGATRHYRVSAINTNGAGGSSNIANATTGTTGTTVPGAPTGLSATASGTTQINLFWTAPASNGGSAISGYKIEVSSNGGSNWTDRVTNTSSATTTYEHTGLAAGATRHYRVSAINTNGAGGSSNIANATTGTTGTTVPGAPTGLSATASGTTRINLTWTAPASNGGSAITGYKIESSSDGGSNWTDRVANASSSTTTYAHNGLAAGATRHYRVSAINTNGVGGSSNIANATIVPLGGGGGGGGGGGPSGPSPSEADFEWTVKRDVEELDSGNDWPTGLWSDGATLWILENGQGADDEVYAYDPRTGERIEEREFTLADSNRAPRGVWSDRETMWVSDSGRDRVFAYTLAGGARDESREIELAERNGDARGIWSDSETMLVLDGSKNALFAYDLATGELLGEYELVSANGDPHGIWSDRVTVWVSDHGAKRLFAYRLPARPEAPAAEDAEATPLEQVRDEDFTELSGASNNSPRGIWSDGDFMYVADESDDKVYTYNMPDALDARLASLTLSGVDFGEFDPGRTDYEGSVAEGVTQTTVGAEAMQRRTDVAIDPIDADVEGDGHQVGLEGLTEITVTVTSADGSRTKTYRVAFPAPSAAAPAASCLRGDIAVGFSLVVHEGGSIEDLEACAQSRSVTALYVPHDGEYVPYILGAADFVNEEFVALNPEGLAALTPLVARSEGPPSPAPASEDVPEFGPDCLRGEIASGFSLVLYEGGSVEDLDSCAQSHGVTAVYTLVDGEYVPYLLGAPDFVNEAFVALFPDGLPAIAPLVAKSDGPPEAN